LKGIIAAGKYLSKNTTERLFLALRLIVGIALIIFLIDYLDYKSIKSAMINSDKNLLLVSGFMGVFNIVLNYYRWKYVCNKFISLSDKRVIRKSLFMGYAAGIWTPMRIGEYFGRSLAIKDKKFSQVIIVTAVEKIFPFIVSILIGGGASIIFMNNYYDVSSFLTISLIAALFLLSFFFIILLNSRDFWRNYVLEKFKKIKFLSKFIEELKILSRLDHSISFNIFALSLLIYLNYTIQMAVLIGAFSLDYSIITFFLISNIIMFTKIFVGPLTMGELGVRESASVYFVGLVGISGAAGFNASLFLFIMNLVIPSLIGLLYLIKRNYA
jgi:uncharacterized membrane protein YbhN (UPF0104 family)